MAIDLHAVTPDFAAEVGDVDLSQPLSPEVLAQIQQAFWTYSVLVFPDQKLTAEQHLAFARHFGPHETSIAVYNQAMPRRVPTQLADVSNLDGEARPWAPDSRQRMFQLGNRLWHTDSSFKYLPALASALYARSIPPVGGRTEYADLRAAYDALPPARQSELEGLVAEHSIFCSRAKLGFTDFSAAERQALPAVPQMLVRTIPQTGRRTLYLASHASHILGVPLEQGRALLAELLEHATQRQFVYSHRWRLQDLVLWDNRCTLHRGTGFDDLRWPRDMQRATVSDIANSCEQAGVQPLAAAG